MTRRTDRGLAVVFLVAVCFAGVPVAEVRADAAPAGSAARPRAPDFAEEHGLVLPTAQHTVDEVPGNATVVLQRETVSLDGVAVGSIGEVLKTQRLTRLDELFDALKERRAAWKEAHAGAAFPGVAVLWLPGDTPLVVAKSIFQTAAFAGYPYLSFAVRPQGHPDRLARINGDAIVPGPPVSAESPALHVTAEAGADVMLTWKLGNRVVSSVTVGERVEADKSAFPILAAAIRQEWRKSGKHRTRNDRRFDSAVLHTTGSLRMQTMVALMDSVYAPSREFSFHGHAVSVPAFDLSLSVH